MAIDINPFITESIINQKRRLLGNRSFEEARRRTTLNLNAARDTSVQESSPQRVAGLTKELEDINTLESEINKADRRFGQLTERRAAAKRRQRVRQSL